MVVGEPTQELRRLLLVVVADRRRLGGEARGDRECPLAHRGLVLVRRPHVAEHADQVEAELLEHGRVGLTVDLDVVEGLPDDVDLAGPGLVAVEHGEQLAVRIALDDEHGVDRDVQAEPVAGELGRQRVGKERHVVGHDLHDGVRGGEPVLVEGGGDDRDLGLAGQPVMREAQVRERRTEEVGHGARDEVLDRDPLVVPLDEGEEEPDLVGRHPLLRVLADVLEDTRSFVGRHCLHGLAPPASPEGSRVDDPFGESPSPTPQARAHRPYRARA